MRANSLVSQVSDGALTPRNPLVTVNKLVHIPARISHLTVRGGAQLSAQLANWLITLYINHLDLGYALSISCAAIRSEM